MSSPSCLGTLRAASGSRLGREGSVCVGRVYLCWVCLLVCVGWVCGLAACGGCVCGCFFWAPGTPTAPRWTRLRRTSLRRTHSARPPPMHSPNLTHDDPQRPNVYLGGPSVHGRFSGLVLGVIELGAWAGCTWAGCVCGLCVLQLCVFLGWVFVPLAENGCPSAVALRTLNVRAMMPVMVWGISAAWPQASNAWTRWVVTGPTDSLPPYVHCIRPLPPRWWPLSQGMRPGCETLCKYLGPDHV